MASSRALWINLRGGEVLAGGSTITQQVARNLLLDPSSAPSAPSAQAARDDPGRPTASAYSKDDILALYLNQSYFGNLAYGIEAAAQAYFGKSAPDLSLAECALLAGLLQSPAAYDPLTNLPAATDRQAEVLDLMAQNGYITQAQADAAKKDALQFAASPFPIQAPHFVMAVIKQLERDYPDQLYHDGLDVVTTVDLDWQQAAQRLRAASLDALNHPDDARQSARQCHRRGAGGDGPLHRAGLDHARQPRLFRRDHRRRGQCGAGAPPAGERAQALHLRGGLRIPTSPIPGRRRP